MDELRGAEALTEAHGLITGPRQAEYDHPFDDYSKVANLFRIMTGVDLTVDEAVTFMVCVKLARLSTNLRSNRWKHDTLVDTIGYLGCLNMVRARREDLRRAYEAEFEGGEHAGE
jgi:hypothetical protein